MKKGYPLIAALISLIGLADSAYLTAKHYQGATVPCSVTGGCEQVLTSAYAEIFGIPTAAFGVIAYFAAFSLSVLAYSGRKDNFWNLFGLLTVLMFAITLILFYLQAFVIGAFCQFCLLSAATTTVLLAVYLWSRFRAWN